jgi:hypothetical protein
MVFGHGSLFALFFAGICLTGWLAGCGEDSIGLSQQSAALMPAPVAASVVASAAAPVAVRVVAGGESKVHASHVRRMIIGPHVNQPSSFPGYGGFVGWESPLRLADGTMMVGFSAGYWHVSLPTPLHVPAPLLSSWQGVGFPMGVEAPTGGRAMYVRSLDGGRTWSRPETLIDTPWDDRHPSFVQLRDGTILAMLFTYPGYGDYSQSPELAYHTAFIRSTDGGRTWDRELRRLPSPFLADASDGPPVQLADGSVVVAAYGQPSSGAQYQIGIFRSTDSGLNWEHLSTVSADHTMSESSLVQLPSGRLVLLARSEGDIAFSDDLGRTFSTPRSFGIRMFEPGLLRLRDGTLMALHGSPNAGGLRVILSNDGGQTWLAPAPNAGFTVDSGVYGYGKGIELPDGSVYVVYIDSGGHRSDDARNEAIWALRIKVRPDHQGIDLLPPF